MKNAPLELILNHKSPVHTLTYYLLHVHFNIILPSALKSSKKSLPFRFPSKLFHAYLDYPMHVTRLAHPIYIYSPL